jgi:hypothetical protein
MFETELKRILQKSIRLLIRIFSNRKYSNTSYYPNTGMLEYILKKTFGKTSNLFPKKSDFSQKKIGKTSDIRLRNRFLLKYLFSLLGTPENL